MQVSDLSPGTVLVARTTEWEYTVQELTDDEVVAEGPHGVIRVRHEDVQADIADGAIQVKS